jgi:hypothetical protein
MYYKRDLHVRLNPANSILEQEESGLAHDFPISGNQIRTWKEHSPKSFSVLQGQLQPA